MIVNNFKILGFGALVVSFLPFFFDYTSSGTQLFPRVSRKTLGHHQIDVEGFRVRATPDNIEIR